MKRLIVFDLDGTLAESRSPLDVEMATLVGALLGTVKVASSPEAAGRRLRRRRRRRVYDHPLRMRPL